MMVATLNPLKVRAELRPKIDLFHWECADALAERFLGPRVAMQHSAFDHSAIERLLAPITATVECISGLVRGFDARMAAIESGQARLARDVESVASGDIGPGRAKHIAKIVKAIAQSRAAGLTGKAIIKGTIRSETTAIYERLKAAADGFSGSWKTLPMGKYNNVLIHLDRMSRTEFRRQKAFDADMQVTMFEDETRQ